jgi:hypothetical protein
VTHAADDDLPVADAIGDRVRVGQSHDAPDALLPVAGASRMVLRE